MRPRIALLLAALPFGGCGAPVDFETCVSRLPGTWETGERGVLRLGPDGNASATNLRLANVDDSMLSIEGDGKWTRPVRGTHDAKLFGSTASFRVELKDDHGNPTSVPLYVDCAGAEPTVVDWAGTPNAPKSMPFRRRR